MVASRIAKRKTTKRGPRLVEADTTARRIEFKYQGRSHLGLLLKQTASWPGSFGSSLPTLRYDPKLLREVIGCDALEKAALEDDFAEMAATLVRIVRQIGMLMSSYDKTHGSITDDEILDLGFTIDGLADLAEQLLKARAEIADAAAAEPIGANAAEPEASHA
jgi:hypothetical protein